MTSQVNPAPHHCPFTLQTSLEAIRTIGAGHQDAIIDIVLYMASCADHYSEFETIVAARCISEWLTYFVVGSDLGPLRKVRQVLFWSFPFPGEHAYGRAARMRKGICLFFFGPRMAVVVSAFKAAGDVLAHGTDTRANYNKTSRHIFNKHAHNMAPLVHRSPSAATWHAWLKRALTIDGERREAYNEHECYLSCEYMQKNITTCFTVMHMHWRSGVFALYGGAFPMCSPVCTPGYTTLAMHSVSVFFWGRHLGGGGVWVGRGGGGGGSCILNHTGTPPCTT